MPTRQSTRASRAEIRTRIEDAAARLFAANGYEATTVDDIVDEAGVSKPALYRFFESKKDLYMQLLERNRDELAAAGLAVVDPNRDPEAWLPAMFDAWFGFVASQPFTYRLLRDSTSDSDIQALRTELQRRQRAADVALLREFASDIPEAQLEPLGEVIRSCLYGLALWWADHPETPRSVLVAAMLRVVRGIVRR